MKVLYEMQDKRCNACFQKKKIEDLKYDHRIPRSRLGPKDMDNAELMCGPCNHAKDDNDMVDFLRERWSHLISHLLRRRVN